VSVAGRNSGVLEVDMSDHGESPRARSPVRDCKLSGGLCGASAPGRFRSFEA